MKRREFVALLGGASAWPLAARAQAERMRRIGVLLADAENDPEPQGWMLVFRKRLQELGWTDDRDSEIVQRWAGGDPTRLEVLAAELAGLKLNVIFCRGTPAVAALQRATRAVPIVFINANDPVGSGFVASLARPGGNITGFISYEPAIGGKWLEMLREIAPGVARVALIYNPKTHTGQHFQSIEAGARSLSVKVIRVPFGDAAEIERGVDNFAREPNGGLLVMPDISTIIHRDSITGAAARHRLPALYPFRLFVASSGLAYYGTDTKDLVVKAAEYVDRILNGEKTANLPVQVPTKYELVINLRSANALGLTVPPTLLARADEVIE